MRFCPYAHRAHLVLDAKSLPYQVTWVNLSQKPEWLCDMSKLGKVPALGLTNECGAGVMPTYIYESLIVADYLDDKFPAVQLHPVDPLAKVLDRLLLEQYSSAVGKLFYQIAFNDGAEAERIALMAALDATEAEYRRRQCPFFGGNTPKMVDYMMWPTFERLASLPILKGDTYALDAQRFPGMVNFVSVKTRAYFMIVLFFFICHHAQLKWKEYMMTLPAVQKWFVSGEDHASFTLSHKNGPTAYDMLL